MKKILVLLLVLSCFSCVSYNVKHSEYDNLSSSFTTDKLVFHRGMLDQIYVKKTISSKTYYTIGIEYNGSSWRFMDGLITIKADEEIIELSGGNSYRSVRSGGVYEDFSGIISREDLLKIASSSSVKMHYYANPTTLSEDAILYIKQFTEEY